MLVPKTNYIHSRNGCIGAGVDHGPADIDAIVAAIRNSQLKRLVIHFHGGLVPKSDGMAIAERLLKVYSPGGYPIFFIWESGAGETVRNNLADIAKESIFQELIRKALEFALGKVGLEEGTRSIAGAAVDPVEVAQQVGRWFADPTGRPPYATGRPSVLPAARAAAQVVDENEIQMNLQADAAFVRALQSIADVPEGTRSTLGIGAVPAQATQMDTDVLAQIAPAPAGETRGLLSMAKVAILVAKIAVRVVKRLLTSRDHGIYVTVVEEVLRAFYIGTIGKMFLWDQMKKDTRDAFGGDQDLHAGTALLARLKAAMAQGLALERIFLVGHSTGGIYISHFLDAIDAMNFDPAVKFDIVLLAPANTHELADRTLTQRAARIRALRMFAMKDELERDDGLLGDDWKKAFYPSSLLYFVSGLLEDKVDEPLMGMRRFLNLSTIFCAPDYVESDRVRTWLAANSDRTVWSDTAGNDPGKNSQSRKHGNFDNDLETLASLAWIVNN